MIEAIEALKNSGKVRVDEDHDWGYQLRFVNEAEYCGKILVLTNFEHGSHHKHSVKDETFVVLCGELFIQGEWGRVLKRPGAVATFRHNDDWADHEMWAKSLPCVIMEVSTHDDDNDIIYMGDD